jgi:predicted type IV restriction endonuclease
VAFVEVKRVAQKLTESHLSQVLAYAVNHGLAWMLLTNGQVWQAYRRSDAAIGSPVAVADVRPLTSTSTNLPT